LVIQEQVDGLGNFHAPPPVFDGIMLMLIYREYHKFLRKFHKFSIGKQCGTEQSFFMLIGRAFQKRDPCPVLKGVG
jgi:hypothetical protein